MLKPTFAARQKLETRGVVLTLPVGPDDVALVRAIRNGEPGAFAALFDRYGSHVRAVLFRTLGPDAELRDLLHDVLVTAVDQMGALRQPDRLRSWLASIAVFTARTCLRKRRRWSWLSNKRDNEHAADSVPPEVNEAFSATYRVLDAMPVDLRLAFSLRYLHGLKLEEVAEVCRVSLATIKRRLARAETLFEKTALGQPALVEWVERGTRWGNANND